MDVSEAGALIRPASARIVSALVQGRRSLTEIAAAVRTSKPTVLATLRRLEEAGWVEREEVRDARGREVFYALRAGSIHIDLRPEAKCIVAWASPGAIDEHFPLTAQIKELDVRGEVLTALRRIKRDLGRDWRRFTVVLFGSAARGELTWKSDIDLAFIFEREADDEAIQAVYDGAAEVQELVSHRIRIHMVPREAIPLGKGALVQEILREGIVVSGERDDPLWSMMTRHSGISI